MISLSPAQLDRLKKNWGEKADSLACKAEVRLYDTISSWECYIFAVSPLDGLECLCIVKPSHNQRAGIVEWTLTELGELYNEHGEGVKIDAGYVPRNAAEQLAILNRGLEDDA